MMGAIWTANVTGRLGPLAATRRQGLRASRNERFRDMGISVLTAAGYSTLRLAFADGLRVYRRAPRRGLAGGRVRWPGGEVSPAPRKNCRCARDRAPSRLCP